MLNGPERPCILEPENMEAGDKLSEEHWTTRTSVILLVLGIDSCM